MPVNLTPQGEQPGFSMEDLVFFKPTYARPWDFLRSRPNYRKKEWGSTDPRQKRDVWQAGGLERVDRGVE